LAKQPKTEVNSSSVSESSCRLEVFGKVVWIKSCWITSKIETETFYGLEKFFDAMKVGFDQVFKEKTTPRFFPPFITKLEIIFCSLQLYFLA
jgi:hypothetical protein